VVIGSAKAFVSPIHIDRLVELRMRRQRRLAGPDFQGLTAVLTEGVIRTVVGGPEVMREQLATSSRCPSATPWPYTSCRLAPGRSPPRTPWFSSSSRRSWTATLPSWTARPRHACTRTAPWCDVNAALAQALPAQESQDLIRAVMKEEL
jgi:hypothetical protein